MLRFHAALPVHVHYDLVVGNMDKGFPWPSIRFIFSTQKGWADFQCFVFVLSWRDPLPLYILCKQCSWFLQKFALWCYHCSVASWVLGNSVVGLPSHLKCGMQSCKVTSVLLNRIKCAIQIVVLFFGSKMQSMNSMVWFHKDGQIG